MPAVKKPSPRRPLRVTGWSGPAGMRQATTWLGDQVQQAVESGMSVLLSSLTKAAAPRKSAGGTYPSASTPLGTLHSHCYHALGRPEIAEGFPTCR